MSIATEITRLQTAKANIKTAIEGKGVSVSSDATLDAYPTLISSIEGGSQSMQIATGSFVGDGTNTVSLDIGFEPDVLCIQSDKLSSESGWTGPGNITFVKGLISSHWRHNNTTQTSANSGVLPLPGNGFGAYGDGVTDEYVYYGVYSHGTLAVSNTTNNGITRYTSGATYTWTAFKYTG